MNKAKARQAWRMGEASDWDLARSAWLLARGRDSKKLSLALPAAVGGLLGACMATRWIAQIARGDASALAWILLGALVSCWAVFAMLTWRQVELQAKAEALDVLSATGWAWSQEALRQGAGDGMLGTAAAVRAGADQAASGPHGEKALAMMAKHMEMDVVAPEFIAHAGYLTDWLASYSVEATAQSWAHVWDEAGSKTCPLARQSWAFKLVSSLLKSSCAIEIGALMDDRVSEKLAASIYPGVRASQERVALARGSAMPEPATSGKSKVDCRL